MLVYTTKIIIRVYLFRQQRHCPPVILTYRAMALQQQLLLVVGQRSSCRVGDLNDEITEGGTNYSVGQRQLIVIARALLHGAKIVLMDEATASIHAETNFMIQKVLRNEMNTATCITVAHRINTVMDSDYTVVMDNGQAIEYDTPTNL